MLENIKLFRLLEIALVFAFLHTHASENTQISPFNLNVDIESQHIWRGFQSTDFLSVAPSVTYNNEKFTAGLWAAQSLDGVFSELDIYLSYSIKNFNITVLDYYCAPENFSEIRFLNYENSTTQHLIDLNFSFNGTTKFPISVLVSTMIYGNDKDPVNNKHNYSTYFEFGYSKEINNTNLDLFLGMTPGNSFYHDKFGVVNVGMKATKSIKTAKKYFPVNASLISNPVTNSIYIVFGLTL